jgi:hypothetical protein
MRFSREEVLKRIIEVFELLDILTVNPAEPICEEAIIFRQF